MKKIDVQLNGKTIKGYAVLRKGILWLHANGETWTTETVARRRGRKSGASSSRNPGEILAPMPGRIIKITAAPGSSVSAGDVVIVMEAMKMEYTLKALAAGSVSEVRVTAGDQVALGAVLAKLEITK